MRVEAVSAESILSHGRMRRRSPETRCCLVLLSLDQNLGLWLLARVVVSRMASRGGALSPHLSGLLAQTVPPLPSLQGGENGVSALSDSHTTEPCWVRPPVAGQGP